MMQSDLTTPQREEKKQKKRKTDVATLLSPLQPTSPAAAVSSPAPVAVAITMPPGSPTRFVASLRRYKSRAVLLASLGAIILTMFLLHWRHMFSFNRGYHRGRRFSALHHGAHPDAAPDHPAVHGPNSILHHSVAKAHRETAESGSWISRFFHFHFGARQPHPHPRNHKPQTDKPTKHLHPTTSAALSMTVAPHPVKESDLVHSPHRLSGHGLPPYVEAPPFPRHWEYVPWQTVEYECIPAYNIDVPIFASEEDHRHWKNLERPFFGCDVKGKGPAPNGTAATVADPYADKFREVCGYKRECSTYQIAFNSSISGDLGDCGIRGPHVAPVRPADMENGKMPTCDNRTLMPIKAPQGAFFGHFMDNIMPKLIRGIVRQERNILVYMEPDYQSEDTLRLAAGMGIEITFDLPRNCFQRIVYTCHTTSFDPLAAQEMSHVLRERYAMRRALAKPPTTTAAPTMAPVPLGEEVETPEPVAPDPKKKRKERKRPVYDPKRPRGYRRVYASRLQGTRNGRNMANEEEFAKMLVEKFDFQVFRGGESLDVWAEALANASIVVGPHGTALSHIFWLNPIHSPVVFELDGFDKFAVFWFVAKALGAHYAWMHFDSSRGVDMQAVEAFLEKTLLPLAEGTEEEETEVKNRIHETVRRRVEQALHPAPQQPDIRHEHKQKQHDVRANDGLPTIHENRRPRTRLEELKQLQKDMEIVPGMQLEKMRVDALVQQEEQAQAIARRANPQDGADGVPMEGGLDLNGPPAYLTPVEAVRNRLAAAQHLVHQPRHAGAANAPHAGRVHHEAKKKKKKRKPKPPEDDEQ